MEPVKGIFNSKLDIISNYEESFVDLVANEKSLLETMEWMFNTAREHTELDCDEETITFIKIIVREFKRRADYCMILAQEIYKKQEIDKEKLEKEILDHAHGQVQGFMLMMEPFVLTVDDRACEFLHYSHFEVITVLYEVIKKAYRIIVVQRENSKRNEVESVVEVESRQRPTTSYGRKRKSSAKREGTF